MMTASQQLSKSQLQLKPKTRNKRTLLIVLASIVVVVLMTISTARAASNLNNLIKLYTKLNQYVNTASEYLHTVAALTNSKDIKNLDQIVQKEKKSLGLPDPVAVGQQVNKAVSTADWKTGPNPSVKGAQAEKDVEQASSRQSAQWVLGDEGQAQAKQENDQTDQAMDDIDEEASTAQNSNVTQDVMKQMALQNAQNTLIEQSIQAETQQASAQLANANMNLTNIGSTLNTQQAQQQQKENDAALGHVAQATFNAQLWN